MKYLFTILLVVLYGGVFSQTTYYVSSSTGNDANNGTSPSTPFKTVLHCTQTVLNTGGMHGGDQLLFKRGETFPCGSDNVNIDIRTSGSAGNNIIIGAYGTGANPIIDGTIDIPNWQTSGNWTNVSGNIWRLANTQAPHRLWVNGTEWARSPSTNTPTASEPYAVDGSYIYLYSSGNPATTYSTIQTILDAYGLTGNDQSYITIQDLDIRRFNGGIDLQGFHDILIQRDSIGWDCSGTGLALEMSGTNTTYNVVMKNCTLNTNDHIFHSFEAKSTEDGVHYTQGTNNCLTDSCTFIDWGHAAHYWLVALSSPYHITNCEVKHSYFTSPDINYGYGPCADFGNDYSSTGNKIDSNIVYHTGLALQINAPYVSVFNNTIDGTYGNSFYEPEGGGIDLTGYYSYPQFERIYNNTIINCTGYGISLHNGGGDSILEHNFIANNLIAFNKGEETDTRGLFTYQQFKLEENPEIKSDTIKNNLFYYPGVTNVIYYGHAPSPYTMNVSTFNSYNGTQGDVISGNIQADPLLDANYKLQAGSPAIGAGIDLGVGTDIGAYSYVSSNVAPIANAGADKAITLPTSSVSVTGTGTDTDGTVTGYQWSLVSGPTSPTFSAATSATTTISNLSQGTYIIKLTVTDNNGAIGTDTMQIVVSIAGSISNTFIMHGNYKIQ